MINSFEQPTALVSGGGGFVGSHLYKSLLDDGYEVYCVDNFGSGRPVNVADLEASNNFSVIEAGIRKPLDLPPVDEVYHLASRASPEDFQNHPVQIALTNTKEPGISSITRSNTTRLYYLHLLVRFMGILKSIHRMSRTTGM